MISYTVLAILILIIILLILKMNNDVFKKEKYIKILVRQASRWALAAKQDENPLIKSLHANYATGYLWALLDIATPQEIELTTNIDFETFKTEIVNIQDESNRLASSTCPNYGIKSPLSKIAGEG